MRIAADQWLVRVKTADGGALKKLNTAEVKRLLEEGLLDPTAKAARHEGDSFRALATYIEFQGSALSRVSKRAADAQGSKFRNLLKKIEEKDKARDEEDEKSKERQEVQPLEDYWHLWKPAALIGGGLLGLVFLWWLFKGLFSGN